MTKGHLSLKGRSTLVFVLTASFVTGCVRAGSTREAVTGSSPEVSQQLEDEIDGDEPGLVGSIGGRPFAPRSAALMWRNLADDALLVFSDAEDICDVLGHGAWPHGATLLLIALEHNAPELRDAPWGEGEYPVRSEGPRAPRDIEAATFAVFDDTCAQSDQAQATSGLVRLTGAEAVLGGEVRGELSLSFGDEHLEGPFMATVCAQPETEPRECR